MKTEAKKFVLYNNTRGKFRSNKKIRSAYGTLPMAIIYKTRYAASRVANTDDVPIEVTINITEEDLFHAVISQ